MFTNTGQAQSMVNLHHEKKSGICVVAKGLNSEPVSHDFLTGLTHLKYLLKQLIKPKDFSCFIQIAEMVELSSYWDYKIPTLNEVWMN